MSAIITPQRYYYKIGFAPVDELMMYCVDRVDRGFDEYSFLVGEEIKNWPKGIILYVEGTHVVDYLLGGLQWIVVSERFRIALDQCGVSGIQYMPIDLVHKSGGYDVGKYYALNVTRIIDALDWERTRWTDLQDVNPHTYPILNILNESLRNDLLNEVDVFRLRVSGEVGAIYFSLRAKECLERAGATRGYIFVSVPVY